MSDPADGRKGLWIYCDCCGTQRMGKKTGDRIVIKAKHHGRDHIVVLPRAAAVARPSAPHGD